MIYSWIDDVKLKVTCYMKFFLMEVWGIGQLYMEFYILLDLQELNLSGEELSWNVTWKLSNCTGIEGCISVGTWNGMIPLWDFNSKALALCTSLRSTLVWRLFKYLQKKSKRTCWLCAIASYIIHSLSQSNLWPLNWVKLQLQLSSKVKCVVKKAYKQSGRDLGDQSDY